MSWQVKTLGELVTIKGGGTPSKKIADYWGGTIPWASVKDLKSRVLLNTEDSITELGVVKSATNVIPKGTIIVPTRMALGKVAITGCDMAINQDLKALIIVDNKQINQCYLARFLESKSSFIESEGKGATVKGITLDFLKSLEIPLPPLDEQKRIAAILDKADAIRQKRKQAIALADEFLRSVFLEMFGDPVTNPKGWDTGSMADFGEFKNGLNYSRDESGVELSYIGVGDFKSHTKLESIEKLSTIQLNENPDDSYLLKDNDLLFVRSNGNRALVGRCLTVHPREKKVTFSGFCIRYRVQRTEMLNPTFVNYCMRMPSMKNAMLKGGQGANIQNINQKTLISLLLPIPPQELQKGFEDLVNQYQRFSERSLVGANTDDALFLSLSQKAFSGQL